MHFWLGLKEGHGPRNNIDLAQYKIKYEKSTLFSCKTRNEICNLVPNLSSNFIMALNIGFFQLGP